MNIFEQLLPDPYPLDESSPSGGIYYVARLPQGWRVFPFRFDEFDDALHAEVWQDHVVPILARQWHRVLRTDPPEPWNRQRSRPKQSALLRLEEGLFENSSAFPRGRITRDGLIYEHLHGDDLQVTGISLDATERPFGLTKTVRKVDDHERCLTWERDAVRKLLGIAETWPAGDTN